jgi:hypothetical protein
MVKSDAEREMYRVMDGHERPRRKYGARWGWRPWANRSGEWWGW